MKRVGVLIATATVLAGCGSAGTGPTVSTVMAPAKTTRTAKPALEKSPEATDAARRVWNGLDGSANSCDGVFDYWPTGGMQVFACHVWSIASHESLASLSPMPIFLRGPHEKGLVLDDERQFGHYNPEFVTWFTAHAIPGADDAAFKAATTTIYDAYVRFLAEIYLAAYDKAIAEPACFAAERDAYAEHVEKGTLPGYYYERWYWWLNDGFCANRNGGFNTFKADDGGFDGNVTKSAMGFWVRRSLDGTMDQWHQGLRKLTQTYP